jgi:hypothetical protein
VTDDWVNQVSLWAVRMETELLSENFREVINSKVAVLIQVSADVPM